MSCWYLPAVMTGQGAGSVPGPCVWTRGTGWRHVSWSWHGTCPGHVWCVTRLLRVSQPWQWVTISPLEPRTLQPENGELWVNQQSLHIGTKRPPKEGSLHIGTKQHPRQWWLNMCRAKKNQDHCTRGHNDLLNDNNFLAYVLAISNQNRDLGWWKYNV